MAGQKQQQILAQLQSMQGAMARIHDRLTNLEGSNDTSEGELDRESEGSEPDMEEDDVFPTGPFPCHLQHPLDDTHTLPKSHQIDAARHRQALDTACHRRYQM